MFHAGRSRRARIGLDEDADGNETVRKYEMCNGIPATAKLAKAFHDFCEPWRNPGHGPSGVVRRHIARGSLLDRPVGRNRSPCRLDHRRIDPRVDRQIGERKLLDDVATLVHDARLQ